MESVQRRKRRKKGKQLWGKRLRDGGREKEKEGRKRAIGGKLPGNLVNWGVEKAGHSPTLFWKGIVPKRDRAGLFHVEQF